MKCPYCGYKESKVIDSRPAEEGSSIRRRRECLSCAKRFTTYETVVSTEYIGELVMDKLRAVDEVAYVRFASVYRQFKDIDTFMKELNKLLESK